MVVGGVDQPLEPVRPAVGVVRGEQVHPVVAPAPVAGELGHRHQLDGVDTQVDQVPEVLDGPVERALGGERADVALVEDRPGQRHPPPAAVAPGEGRVVDHPGRAVDARGLGGRARVGTGRAAVETERVVGARAGLVD